MNCPLARAWDGSELTLLPPPPAKYRQKAYGSSTRSQNVRHCCCRNSEMSAAPDGCASAKAIRIACGSRSTSASTKAIHEPKYGTSSRPCHLARSVGRPVVDDQDLGDR